jgi:hypothetical protein
MNHPENENRPPMTNRFPCTVEAWTGSKNAAHMLTDMYCATLISAVLLGLPGHSLADTSVRTTDMVQAAAVSHPLLPGSRLLGEAAFQYWGLRIYHARLWTLPAFRADFASDHPLVLELEYQRDLKGAAIAERSLSEMLRSGPIHETQARQWLTHMQRLFPDIKTGDKLTGQHHPGQGASFAHNGRQLGRIDDPDFARRFFEIWLGPSTSQPDMRTALLGLGPIKDR